jgi:hypothetical protein
VEENIHMAAPDLFELFSTQTHNSSLLSEPMTWPTADSFKK